MEKVRGIARKMRRTGGDKPFAYNLNRIITPFGGCVNLSTKSRYDPRLTLTAEILTFQYKKNKIQKFVLFESISKTAPELKYN